MKKILLPICLIVSLSILAQLPAASETQVATAGTLNVTVTTAGAGGKYAPKNVMAIWVVNSSGAFVKTLMGFGASEKAYLTNWKTATPTYNIVDAISGATKTTHGVRTCSWNGTNVTKTVVDDGTYTLKMELTDKSSTGNVGSFSFNKSNVAQTLTPSNVPSFSSISIQWVPTSTAVINQKDENSIYRIYPNPAKESIFVNGYDIESIDIIDAEGRTLFNSNIQRINVSNLISGVYFARINTKNKSITQKIIIE